MEVAVEGRVDRAEIQLTDPRNGNAPMQWEAEIAFPDAGRDVMRVRNAMPFLRDLPAVAEAHGQWDSARVIGDVGQEYPDPKQRDSDRCTLTTDAARRVEAFVPYGIMMTVLEVQLIRLYQQMTNASAVVQRGTGYDLLRYRKGQRFGVHVDAVREHPTLGHRRLAVVAFCNADFVGGGLRFPRQDLVVQPEAGALVMFPATFTHPHEALPVEDGVRYSVVTWFM